MIVLMRTRVSPQSGEWGAADCVRSFSRILQRQEIICLLRLENVWWATNKRSMQQLFYSSLQWAKFLNYASWSCWIGFKMLTHQHDVKASHLCKIIFPATSYEAFWQSEMFVHLPTLCCVAAIFYFSKLNVPSLKEINLVTPPDFF